MRPLGLSVHVLQPALDPIPGYQVDIARFGLAGQSLGSHQLIALGRHAEGGDARQELGQALTFPLAGRPGLLFPSTAVLAAFRFASAPLPEKKNNEKAFTA